MSFEQMVMGKTQKGEVESSVTAMPAQPGCRVRAKDVGINETHTLDIAESEALYCISPRQGGRGGYT